MTLNAVLKYDNGIVLASDTRVIMGDMKRDGVNKIEVLTPSIGVATAGLTGAIDDILAKVMECLKSQPAASFDSVAATLSDETFRWHKANSEKLDEEDNDYACSFILASAMRMRKVHTSGYSEEIKNYDCDGDGKPYGEYILQNYYTEGLTEDKAKELAAYTIIETSKVDPSVGDQLQLVVFREGAELSLVSKEEAEDLKLRVAPLSRAFTEEQISKVEKIVEYRDNINVLWQKLFKYKLFLPYEKAIFQIMKPCRSEEEFIRNIGALALLLEQMDVKEMKKKVKMPEAKSVSLLEGFLTQELGSAPYDFISNFRDIIRLRSTSFPIHKPTSDFVEIVIKLSGEYPPKWAKLYLRALNIYTDSLESLLELVKKHNEMNTKGKVC